MSSVVNTVLGFLTEHYVVLGYVVVAAILLGVAYVVVRSHPSLRDNTARQRRAPTPPPSYQKLVSEERDRLSTLVGELRSHNHELKTRLSRLANQSTILAPLIKELNSNLDRRMMGPIVQRVLERIFNPEHALVFFMDPDKENLTLMGNLGVPGLKTGHRFRIGDSFAGLVAQKKHMLTKDEVGHEPTSLNRGMVDQTSDATAMYTDIATPIMNRNETLGVLCVGGVSEFTEDDRALFGMVGDLTALALMNYLQYRKIEELANHDPLTETYNKGYFLKACKAALGRARQQNTPMSLLMFDVDNFKNYNDTNGHLAGDRLLTALAQILKDAVRDEDIVARFGGEEFIILLRSMRIEAAMKAAERIRKSVEEHPFENGGSQPLGCLSVSGGVAAMPDHAEDMEQLIERADEALYAAKDAGRNRVLAAGSHLDSRSRSSEAATKS